MDYIKNYKGGELEPEWDWVKNISVVYTWVDGNDADYLDLKSKYNGGFRKFDSGDRSADELRYSIRSLVKYMPWHNGTIYIVTNKQVPKWLDTTNPRVKMVFDEDLLPKHMAPLYDSNAIELYFDRIPGITEYFFYLNDDFFLNNYIHPCFYFSRDGFYPKVYRTYKVKLNKETIDEYIKKNNKKKRFEAFKYNTREITRQYFDPKYEYHYYLHSVHVLYRDLMEPFRQLFKEEIKTITSDKFRSFYEIHSHYLYQNYLYYATKHDQFPLKLSGEGKASLFEGSPLPNRPDRTVKKYSCIMESYKISKSLARFFSVTNNYNDNIKKFEKIKSDENLLVYNLNNEYTKDIMLFQLLDYMMNRYPDPSPFEKKEYVDLELSIKPLFDKINDIFDIFKYNLTEKFQDDDTNKFSDVLTDYKLSMLNKYIENRSALSEPRSEISKRETEEIKFINSYKGEDLKKDWKWVSNISLVYIYDGNSEDQDRSTTITESEKLKYSIRSVEKNLSWFKGTIFIVTRTEIPKDDKDLQWVNRSNSRIKIVSQNEIIPSQLQDSNNKNMVHMFLDKIPGISERFIYLKNNHYFIHNTHPRFFFSTEFYPKYNFGEPLDSTTVKNLNLKDKPFLESNEIIQKYFGKTYFKSYRYFLDAPCPLYRDLYEPARQLYKEEINQSSSNEDILPLYLVTNYNIYGTVQPYFPEYVTGYGMVREAETPKLNPKRTIDFYGFDITSKFIAKSTLISELTFTKEHKKNLNIIRKIKDIKKERFFSIKFIDENNYSDKIKNQYENLLNDIYSEKSSFENN